MTTNPYHPDHGPREVPQSTGTSPITEQITVSRYAWMIVFMLMPVALLNYMDRQMISAMKSSVMGEISIANEADWGRMLGQFKWVYAIFSPIGGLLADRLGRRLTICGSLFAWSAVTALTGMVQSYEQLLWARSLMGISEAFYIPAALAMISDYHPGNTRSRAVGFHQTGIYLGVIVGGFGGYVADAPALGWRSGFLMAGIVGVLYSVPLLLSLRDRPVPAATNQSSGNNRPSLNLLLLNGSFWLLVAYFTLPALAGWVVRDWGPSILKKEFDLGQGIAGVSATTYWQVAAIVAAFLGGWLADAWYRRNVRGKIYVSAIGMVLIVPAMLGIAYSVEQKSFAVAIAALVLFGIGWGLFDGNNMPILSQIAPPALRATGYGIMNFVSISFGGVADWLFGRLQDRGVGTGIIFAGFAATAVVSVVLVLLIRPRPVETLQ